MAGGFEIRELTRSPLPPEHAITLRAPHSVADIVIVEGYDGVQPGDS